MIDSPPDPRSDQPCRVLFIRSNAQSTFAAFIAMGLDRSSGIVFEQYPFYRDSEWEKLDKIYDPIDGRAALARQTIKSTGELRRKIKNGAFDLVLLMDYDARLSAYSKMGWIRKWRNVLGHFKKIFRTDLNTIRYKIGLTKGLPLSPAEMNSSVPVAVIDLDDWICLPPAGQDHLLSCSGYFKREVSMNRFFLFYQNRPSPWREKREELLPIVERIRNIPLGIEDQKYFDLKKRRRKIHDIDIFYCGAMTSTLRCDGLKLLESLSGKTGLNVVIAGALSFEEYCQYVARSKITLSISGGGWDCFRHYETIALGSVPLMDRPAVDAFWWRTADEGVFFNPDFSDFTDKLYHLLENSPVRENCRRNIEKLVETHMLHSKIVNYIVDASIDKSTIVQ